METKERTALTEKQQAIVDDFNPNRSFGFLCGVWLREILNFIP